MERLSEAAVIFTRMYLIHGWPLAEGWYEVLYPCIGAAIVPGIYSLIVYLGHRRLERIAAQRAVFCFFLVKVNGGG